MPRWRFKRRRKKPIKKSVILKDNFDILAFWQEKAGIEISDDESIAGTKECTAAQCDIEADCNLEESEEV